jgi:hypothetical protein
MTRRDRKRDDVLEVWWMCLRPHCFACFLNPRARDEHMATCGGCEEVPF